MENYQSSQCIIQDNNHECKEIAWIDVNIFFVKLYNHCLDLM